MSRAAGYLAFGRALEARVEIIGMLPIKTTTMLRPRLEKNHAAQ
jgi:hypothetical protein